MLLLFCFNFSCSLFVSFDSSSPPSAAQLLLSLSLTTTQYNKQQQKDLLTHAPKINKQSIQFFCSLFVCRSVPHTSLRSYLSLPLLPSSLSLLLSLDCNKIPNFCSLVGSSLHPPSPSHHSHSRLSGCVLCCLWLSFHSFSFHLLLLSLPSFIYSVCHLTYYDQKLRKQHSLSLFYFIHSFIFYSHISVFTARFFLPLPFASRIYFSFVFVDGVIRCPFRSHHLILNYFRPSGSSSSSSSRQRDVDLSVLIVFRCETRNNKRENK